MKKLIVLSVIFALVAGSAFAADVSASAISSYELMKGKTGDWDLGNKNDDGTMKIESAKPEAGGWMNRLRFDASGEVGQFGGYVRAEAGGFGGNAWWKPMDMLLVRLGGNGGDGFWGKDGVTRWGFYQTIGDTGVTFNGDNAWGGSIYGIGANFSSAFYGGDFGNGGLMVEFNPAEMFGLNIGVPFTSGELKDVYQKIVIQANLNLDFGNIAITFAGNSGKFGLDSEMMELLGKLKGDPDDIGSGYDPVADGDLTADELKKLEGFFDKFDSNPMSLFGGNGAKIYAYFGMPINDNISFDIGFGYTLPVKSEKDDGYFVGDAKATYNAPIGIGAGFKFTSDSFGLKARVGAELGGKYVFDSGVSGVATKEYAVPLKLLFDIMPFFSVADNVTVFVSAGIGMQGEQTLEDNGVKADSVFGWHINPIIQVGEEWGPKFLAGIKLWADGSKDDSGKKDAKEGSNYINWAIPIAISVSF